LYVHDVDVKIGSNYIISCILNYDSTIKHIVFTEQSEWSPIWALCKLLLGKVET